MSLIFELTISVLSLLNLLLDNIKLLLLDNKNPVIRLQKNRIIFVTRTKLKHECADLHVLPWVWFKNTQNQSSIAQKHSVVRHPTEFYSWNIMAL